MFRVSNNKMALRTRTILLVSAVVCMIVTGIVVLLVLYIKKVPVVPPVVRTWTFQGCWLDRFSDPTNSIKNGDLARAIPNLAVRVKTFEECQQFTIDQQADVMAFQNGRCWYGNLAKADYRKYGQSPSAFCNNPKNGPALVNPVHTLNA